MNKYYHDKDNNKILIGYKELYNTYNLIKGIHNHAIYFFNGFSQVKGTTEVVINLIKADLNFKEYHVKLYDDYSTKISFSEKYEFVNFNEIKSNVIKHEIVEAIKERNSNMFDEILEFESPLLYDEFSYKPHFKWNALSSDAFDYEAEAVIADGLLEDVINSIPAEPKLPLSGVFSSNDSTNNIIINSGTGLYSSFYDTPNDLQSSGTVQISSGSNNVLMYDGKSELKMVNSPQNNMKILSKKSKKKNNKISIKEDKLIVL